MKNTFNTEDFLARWSSNQLTEDEKIAFEKSEDYKWYQAIIEGTEALELPPFNKETSYNKVMATMTATPTKVRSLFPNWLYGVAASALIVIGLFFYFNNQNTTYETGSGEQMAIILPDGSEVLLNAQSQLSYDNDTWNKKRTLNLKGQAYFKVQKGEHFVVNTGVATVSVLGTRFSVQEDESIFEAVCFEGKVAVNNGTYEHLLTMGNAVRFVGDRIENWNTTQDEPSWIQERSTYKNAPLNQVLIALGKQYSKKMKFDGIDANLRFTGSFTHNNLELALRTICESMEINFTFKDENTIVFVNK